MIDRFGIENVGVLTGPSELTVVDIDEPSAVEEMLERFGPTPLVVMSPRRGAHLYYRSQGEPSRTRVYPGVDVRGYGGLIIAPPSRRPDGLGSYQFQRGAIEDFRTLPPIRPGALPNERQARPRFASRDKVRQGHRNDWLFGKALLEAPACDNFDQMLDVVRTRNAEGCETPLPDDEVVKIARSAWRYEVEDRNWVVRSPRKDQVSRLFELADDPGAYVLLEYLRLAHQGARQTFAISPEAVAARLGWGKKTVIRKIRTLVFRRLLICTHRGGRGLGDVSLYQLSASVSQNGTQ